MSASHRRRIAVAALIPWLFVDVAQPAGRRYAPAARPQESFATEALSGRATQWRQELTASAAVPVTQNITSARYAGKTHSSPTRRKFLNGALAGLASLMISKPAKAQFIEPTKARLTPDQQAALRRRVDRFAAHFQPDLSEKEREQIVEETVIFRPSVFQRIRRFIYYSAVLLVIGGGLIIWLAARWRMAAKHPGTPSALRPALRSRAIWAGMLGFVSWITAASSLLVATLLTNPYENAGGAVIDGKIHLPESVVKQLGAGEDFIQIVDHELAHLFGEGFHGQKGRLRRHAWLASAYATVLAMERGGTATVGKAPEFFATRQISLERLYWFYQGVLAGASQFSPYDREVALITTVIDIYGHPDPDALSDSPVANPAADANRALAFGLAGLAWVVSGGLPEKALSYLDARANGASAGEADQQARNGRGFYGEYLNRINPLVTEAILFLRQHRLRPRSQNRFSPIPGSKSLDRAP